MLRTLRTRLRLGVRMAVHCSAFKVSMIPDDRGWYPMWMCRRLRFHRGGHRDCHYADAEWSRHDDGGHAGSRRCPR